MPLRTREIIKNTTLSSTARLALLWLRTTAKNGVSNETSASLGNVLGVTVQTVAGISRELTDAGFVRRESAGRGTGRKRWVLLPTEQPSLVVERTVYGTLPRLENLVTDNRPGAA